MKQGEEWHLQSACIKWFRLQYPQWMMFSVPMEAIWKNKNYFEGSGAMSGVSDTIILMDGRVLFVEFKSRYGRQSPVQVNFQKDVERLGFEYKVIKSFDEFQQYILNYDNTRD